MGNFLKSARTEALATCEELPSPLRLARVIKAVAEPCCVLYAARVSLQAARAVLGFEQSENPL